MKTQYEKNTYLLVKEELNTGKDAYCGCVEYRSERKVWVFLPAEDAEYGVIILTEIVELIKTLNKIGEPTKKKESVLRRIEGD